MSVVGRVFSNRYEIQRELAQGGMAEVYLARDQLLDRPVALKALFPEYAREPSFVERFRREAQAAANLNHPNIVAIYDWGQESGTYFIVMEYVEGRSLRDLIRAEGPLDAPQAAQITAEIASALAFAHRGGVVHRDVKPGNVLLTRSGVVKVTDFGIARAGAGDGLTQTGSVMGTATYFSPEQAQGLPVDGRSDVYSLGVVLYEMVTGVVPFTGDSPIAVAYKHVREPPVPPSQRNPDVPPDLEQIVLTALAKDPDHRYQSADDLRDDLVRFRRGRPLAAAPVTAIVSELPTAAVPTNAGALAAATTVVSPRVVHEERAAYAGDAGLVRRRSNTALVTVLVLLGLAALVGGILFAATRLGSAEKVSVPDVTGKQLKDAQQQLQSAHLGWKVVRDASSLPKDAVISQDPQGSTTVKRDSTVTLHVSAGQGQQTIPDLANQLGFDAVQTLKNLGFDVKTASEPSDTVALSHVTRTDPKAGTAADIGSTLTVYLSSGPPTVAVPDVTGQPQDQAATTLSNAGFPVQILSEASATVAQGSVTRTDPAAGASAPKGSTVKLYVSSGTPQVPVPDVRGQTQAAATSALAAAQLQVTVRNLQVLDPSKNGVVFDQNPPPGQKVDQNSTVTLYVGQYATPTTTAPATTTTS